MLRRDCIRSMKKKIIIGVVALALAGVAAFIVLSPTTDSAMMAMGANTIVISTVNRGDLRQVVTANGSVELERIEPVYSSVEYGTRLRVAEVLVEVGDYVTVGQTIVTYDVEHARNNIDREISNSQIALENQRLSIQAQTLGPTPLVQRDLREQLYAAQEGIVNAEELIIDRHNNIVNANNDINDQRQRLENARRAHDQAMSEVEVNSRILALGGITQHMFDEIVQAADNRRTELESAQIDLANGLLALENAERALETAERGLETAQRGLEYAELNYSLTIDPLSTESARIQHAQALNNLALAQAAHNALLEERDRLISETVSHVSGTVMDVEVTVGAQVQGTSKLIDVADFSNLIVTAMIREVDAPQVFVGQNVTMTSAGLPGMIYNGTVTRVSPTATYRQAHTGMEIVVPIEISVDNPDDQLRPGFSVDIEIVLVESTDTVSISLMSIMQDFETGQEYVMLVDENNILRRRDITRGLTTALEVEVLEGLEEGDVIILTPTPVMQDGDLLPEDAVEAGGFEMGAGEPGGGGGAVVRRGGGGGAVVIRR